jgi:hypothetical protein
MVGCDVCDEWFHYKCIGLKRAPQLKEWLCFPCKEKAKEAGREGAKKAGVKAKEDANKEPFREAEDQKILTLQRTMGNNWASIAKELGTNRTAKQIRGRFGRRAAKTATAPLGSQMGRRGTGQDPGRQDPARARARAHPRGSREASRCLDSSNSF